MSDGRLLHVNVSDGGVPKRAVASARVTRSGVEGDRQRAATVHGGPHRAVSLLGIEAIRRVAAEGHPIAPGTTGENLTVEGFDVSTLPLGTRVEIGEEVILELSAPTNPCRTIRHSFRDLRFGRLSIAAHPTDSRMYARVVREGTVRPGDPIHLMAPAPDADAYLINARLDRAERASTLAIWRAASAAGHDVSVVDDGEIAVGAASALPGPMFNLGLGFAHLPNLVEMALRHFSRFDVTGWVVADEPPWIDAKPDATFGRYVAEPAAVAALDGAGARALGRDEIGAWAEIITAASDMPPSLAEAWRSLEPHLAAAAHHHRSIVELDGRPAATGSLHTHHGVGWMRAGSVLPEYRGRGLQRALIVHRARAASRLGCELIGASAVEGGASALNLERLGFRRVGTRRTYPTA